MRRIDPVLSLTIAALIAAASQARAVELGGAVTLDIAPAPLESALLELSRQTGLQLVVPAGALPAEPTQRISGSMPLDSAMDLLLRNTPLTYKLIGERTLTIVPRVHESSAAGRTPSALRLDDGSASDATVLLASRETRGVRPGKVVTAMNAAVAAEPADRRAASDREESDTEVIIRGQKESEGTAEQGYRAKSVSQLGVLGAKAIEDAPFSINVVPPELIQNRMATAPDEIMRINPVVQLETPQSRFFTTAVLRGFSVGSNNQIDGMRNGYYTAIDIEDKERIEIVTGLSAFLYGAGNVGGTVNYVLKRPTAEPYRSLSVGNTGGDNYYAHLDLGGPIDSAGRFGYRLNVVGQDGDTYVDYQSLNRNLVSGAFDWNIGENAHLQIDASWADSDMKGTETYWYPLGVTQQDLSLYHDVPDTGTYFGQPQSYTKAHREHVAGRFMWDINEKSTLRAAVSRRKAREDLLASLNLLVTGTTYWPQVFEWEYPDVRIDAAYLFADTRFKTGAVEHHVTGGLFGDEAETTNFRNSGVLLITDGTDISDPLYIDEAPPPPTGPKYLEQRVKTHNFVVGDEITLGGWTALLGLTRTTLDTETFDELGDTAQRYKESKTTPAATLLYRVTPRLRLYGNYMKSFEPGGVAAGQDNVGRPVVNAGEALPPLSSKQVELGAKYAWGGALFTAALFDIDRPREVYVDSGGGTSRFTQSGREVHRGGEFTLSGRIAPRLTLIGGLTLLDAKIRRMEDSDTPELQGSTPQNVAEKQFKLYGEYDLAALPGLALTAGVYHTGTQEITLPNGVRIPSFTTGDIGVRYARQVWNDRKLTLRLNVNNVTDEDYWLNYTFMGAPRNVTVGAQLQF